MPAPFMNFRPRGAGWDRPNFTLEQVLRPNEVVGWQPEQEIRWPRTTEPGGAMLRRSDSGMSGMGDMFTYPEGTGPQAFYEQQIQSGAMPPPEFAMDEAHLYRGESKAGTMPWEAGPAPWEEPAIPQGMPTALAPSAAAPAAATVEAEEAKAKQAAQAAKVAADNAVRAAHANAPKVAATNAATAQAAANVAAAVAKSPRAQQAAAVAQSEATKAVAAANVAAQNNGQGMGDWMELSGLGGSGTEFFSKYKWYLLGGAALLGAAWYTKGKYW